MITNFIITIEIPSVEHLDSVLVLDVNRHPYCGAIQT